MNKVFSVYSKSTGEIRSRVICCEEDIPLQYDSAQEDIVFGMHDAKTQRVKKGKVVEKTQSEKAKWHTEVPTTPIEQQESHITNEQLQGILTRLDSLETKAKGE